MIYHYTDRDSAADAVREKLLKAHPVLVRTQLIGGEELSLAPAVWFTTASTPPSTMLAKLTLGGWPLDKPGMIWRFVVADEAAPEALDQWAERHGYEPEAFRWMLFTARLAGEDWQQWRVRDDGVPAEKWLAVESLANGIWEKQP